MRGAGRSNCVWVLAVLAGSSSLANAEAIQAREGRFRFDCSVAPMLLTIEQQKAIADGVGRKWNLGMAPAGALQSKVTVRVCLTEQGRPEHLILLAADGPNEDAVEQLFHTARRAIQRAGMDGGLPLPPDNDDTRRVIDLVFDANGMTAR
jgi:hypothetical protein